MNRGASAVPLVEPDMLEQRVRLTLRDTLQLGDRADRIESGTILLGAVPELDSMAVVSVLTALEEQFGFVITDDEVSAETFATFGSLVDFVRGKSGQ